MSFLKRHLAPLSETAWEEIDEEARNILTARLAARKFVDVKGPLGFDYSSINLGTLEPWQQIEGGGLYARRLVQPLVEMRIPFSVSRVEMENLERGATDVDVEPVTRAAQAASHFEERALFHGDPATQIGGLVKASEHKPVKWGKEVSAMPDRVTSALIALTDAGVEGPYLLVLGEKPYRAVAGDVSAYPMRQQLTKLVGSEPVYSPGLEHGMLVSTRGGDFELTLGLDMSIGFDRVEGDQVHLYLCETFTFRVIGGEALINLK